MKKIFIKLCTVAVLGLALTACNNDEANKKAMDAANSSVDQMVQDRMKGLDDSISKDCDTKLAAAVENKIDSMAAAGHKAAQAHRTVHPHVATPAPVEAKKTEPAKPDPGSVNTRPGAVNNNTPASTNDRPGANTNNAPKSVNDRPGAH